MKYLKLTNVPIKLINSKKYGGDGKKIPWEACGFNPVLLSLKSVQYSEGDNHYSYLPISDEDALDSKMELMAEDVETLGNDSAVDIVDAEYKDLLALRVAAQPVEK